MNLDDRHDPLAKALRREAERLPLADPSPALRVRILADLERPSRARPVIAWPLLAGLAAAALLAVVILPGLIRPAAPPTAPAEALAAGPAPAPTLALPAIDLAALLANDPTDRLHDEMARLEDDLQRVGRFLNAIVPARPTPLPLL